MKECPNCSLCYDDSARFCTNDGSQLIESLPGGRVVDERWRIERVLGVGRHGSTYVARDIVEDRTVLLKTLLPTLFREQGSVDTFLEVSGLLCAFEHPNAARTFAGGRLDNGGAYLATEYLAGQSLKGVLQAGQPLDVGRTADIGAMVADALGAAHERGLLHRDVKPDNIILAAREDGSETAYLVDFEMARWLQSTGGSSMTATGSFVIRLPHYSSPEQCRGKAIDARSDLYSLGIVLYQMLTGQLPFDAPSPMAVIVQHVTDPPEPPTSHRKEIPKAFEELVLRALAKAADERIQTGAEMAGALRAVVSGQAHEPTPTTLPRAEAPSREPEPVKPSAKAADAARRIPPPPEPLPMQMTIVDAGDESNVSRRIAGRVHDVSENGMRVETGTIETGQLHIIRDHTTAFKNRLDIEVTLPDGPIKLSGFAAWYKPSPDGLNWNVGVYIRDMTSADRGRYRAYLERLKGDGAGPNGG